MKTLLLALACSLMASCTPITAVVARKKPFPPDSAKEEQMYALYFDGSAYEEPVGGWAAARARFMHSN